MPGCYHLPFISTCSGPLVSVPLLSGSFSSFVGRAQAACLYVNVNLDVVKGYFVSTRKECGQTNDIPAAHLDSWSPNQDFDQSPQSGSLWLSLNVLIPVTSHILLTLCSVGLSLYLQSRFLLHI